MRILECQVHEALVVITIVLFQFLDMLSQEAAVIQSFFLFKAVIQILQYSQENTYVGVSFQLSSRPEGSNFIYKGLQHRCSPLNIAKFLRTFFS